MKNYLDKNLKNRITVIEGIIHQDGEPLKKKSDPIYCTCSKCNEPFILQYRVRQRRINRNKKYGRPYPDFNICGKCSMNDNLADTLLKETGYKHALQNPKTLDKVQNTMMERHGVHAAMLNEELKQKQQQSTFDHLGVYVSSKHPDVVSKMIQTNKEKYGYDYTCQVPEIRAKQDETRRKNFETSEIYRSSNPNPTLLENNIKAKLEEYFLHNNLNDLFEIKQEYKIGMHYFDIAIINKIDGTINSLIECDGLFAHGYKFGYDFLIKKGLLYNNNKTFYDERRLKISIGFKVFIIRESFEKANKANENDFNLLINNLFVPYQTWFYNEMSKYMYEEYCMQVQNSFDIYKNFMISQRLNHNGVNPYMFNDKRYEQDDYYIEQNTIGITPFDLKLEKDYY